MLANFLHRSIVAGDLVRAHSHHFSGCWIAALQNTMVGDLVWLFCVLLVLTLVGRAAFVFPLSLLHNWYAQEQLSFKEMIVIWCAPLQVVP